MADEAKMTPQQHAQHIMQMIQAAQAECYADVERIQDPQGQVVLRGVGEILDGAISVLVDYQNGKEPVWRSGRKSYEAQAVAQRPQFAPPTETEFAVDVDAAEPPPRLINEMPGEQ